MTLVDALIKLKDDKAKGAAFKDSEDINRPARSILTLKPLPTIDPKDKGKVARDEEIARQLEVELQAEVEREKHREEQASMNYIANLYDEVQARIEADHELAVRLTNEEKEKFTHSQLNKKRFEDIQGLYMKEKELIADFVPIGSEEDERRYRDMNKKAEEESSDKDLVEEGIIDYEVLDKRFLIITWELKFYHYDRHGAEGIYYRIFKSDGSSRWIKTFSKMVTRFDRLDLVELYNLVMQRFETTTLKGVDLILWGDLRTMFKANTEDELWQNQEE
nr:hypothetical protein [Tanacetum cinerariifolium]